MHTEIEKQINADENWQKCQEIFNETVCIHKDQIMKILSCHKIVVYAYGY